MENLFEQRREFNDAFRINSNDHFDLLSPGEYGLEFNMLNEELHEYFTACKDNNRVEIADAIGDILYLIIGTACKHGLDAEELRKVMNEIHRSNIT